MRSEMFSLQGRLPKLSRPSSTNVSAFAVPPAPHYPVTPGITYLRTVLLTSARRCARAARCAQSTETLAFSLSNVRGLFSLRPSLPITYTEIFRQSIIKRDLVFHQPRHLSPLFGLLISAAISMNSCMNPAAGNALEWCRAAKPYERSEKARFWMRMPLSRIFHNDSRSKFFWRG